MKEHIKYIDALKGGAILLVIMGHCLDLSCNIRIDGLPSILWDIIYTFHMGLFMFLSGMTRKIIPLNLRTTRINITKRIIRLIVPFLSWGILTSFITNNSIYSIIKFPDKGLWFLPTLFYICLIFDVAQYLSYLLKKNNYFFAFIGYIILLLIVNFITGGFGLWFAAYYFIYYFIGILFSQHANKMLKYNKFIIPFCIIMYLYLFQTWSFAQVATIPDILLNYSIALCAILPIVLTTIIWYQKGKQSKPLEKLGLDSLGIYASHFYFIWFFIDVLGNLSIYPIIKCIIVFIFSTIGSIIVCKILPKNRITSFLFIGKY